MSYLVLARKCRPQTFESLVGQEHVARALSNAIARDRVPHALLFTGPRGVGKTSSARIFARALNCTANIDNNEIIEPCGECTNCIEIAKSTSIAVREIDGASNNSVDNVRELIESLRSLPPPGSNYKIYIIDEVHMLSTAAFNALLKSLEEPPPNTIFIFATTEPHKIPETVVSRCQRHDFRNLTTELIIEQLGAIAESEGINVNREVLQLVADKAQGGMRDALSLFDRLLAFSSENIELEVAQKLFGVVDRKLYEKLSFSVLTSDIPSGLAAIDEAFEQSIDLRSFIADFVSYWRELFMFRIGIERSIKNLDHDLSVELQEKVREYSEFDLQRLFEISEQTATRALNSNFPRYVLEAGIAKMATLPSLKPIPELIAKLERLDSSTGVIDPPSVASVAKEVAAESKVTNAVTKAKPSTFNPSWEGFVNFVHDQSEVVLSAYLRRVTPRIFSAGELTIAASEFDRKSLCDSNTSRTLETCLHKYSDISKWSIRFEDLDTNAGSSHHSAAHGSLIEKEAQRESARKKKVESEAREDPLTKLALSTFEGSHIERVSVVEK